MKNSISVRTGKGLGLMKRPPEKKDHSGSKSADTPELPIRTKRHCEDSSPTGPPKRLKPDDRSGEVQKSDCQ